MALHIDANNLFSSQPGVATVAATVAYENSGEEGAILLTDGDIKHNVADPQYRYLDWMDENVEELAKRKDVRDNGVWIVTKTFTATRRALAVAASKNSKVAWSVSAEVADAGGVEAAAEWWHGHKDSCWITHEHVRRGSRASPRRLS
jgi:hypothetical protein